MQATTIIKNGLIVTPTGVANGDLAIKDGKIAAIGELSEDAAEVIDAQGQLVLPGWWTLTCTSMNRDAATGKITILAAKHWQLVVLQVWW